MVEWPPKGIDWYYSDEYTAIACGDCREILLQLEPHSFTACITDPPYGLKFMGKGWDHGVPGAPFWQAVRHVLKPGSMLMAFGGTRTWHRLACAIEDAGFELRDTLMWMYGSGFPKSHDISKAIDKAAGAEREVVGFDPTCRLGMNRNMNDDGWNKIGQQGASITAPATDAAKQWDGYGTALKPAYEPIILSMNPLDGTFAENALHHGVAGLNIDGGRVETTESLSGGASKLWSHYRDEKEPSHDRIYKDNGATNFAVKPGPRNGSPQGRWPANVLLDEEAARLLDTHTEDKRAGKPSGTGSIRSGNENGRSIFGNNGTIEHRYDDGGGASRFFWVAKATQRDRGTHNKPALPLFDMPEEEVVNTHPTVKPSELMERLLEYLCTLITMPANTVLVDPFMGSGTTLVAAKRLGIRCIGIDNDMESCEIAAKRLRQEVLPLRY